MEYERRQFPGMRVAAATRYALVAIVHADDRVPV
jgi:hypothetical protein